MQTGSDDIVTRLTRAKSENFGHYSAPLLTPILEDAIREIENLRNKVEIQRSILDLYSETCECDGCAPCCQYEQDVRHA